MKVRRQLTIHVFAWLALVGTLMGEPTLGHHHEPIDGESAASEIAWTPDDNHDEHSTQWGLHAAVCAICRVIDANVLPGAATRTEAWIGAFEAAHSEPMARAARAKTRRHPPRAPPEFLRSV